MNSAADISGLTTAPMPACEAGTCEGLHEDDRVQLYYRQPDDVPLAIVHGADSQGCVVNRLGVAPPDSSAIPLGALRSRPQCPSRLSVLLREARLEMLENFSPWNEGVADVITLPQRPRIIVPVSFWLVTGTPELLEPEVRDQLRLANAVLRCEHAGVEFAADHVHDAHEHPAAGNYELIDGSSKPDIDKVIGKARGVNVYYVKELLSHRGKAFEGPMVIIDANRAEVTTLGHELGHTLSLIHTEGYPGMRDSSNLMSNDLSSRTFLTSGQAQRASVSERSVINLLQLRQGEPLGSCDRTGKLTMHGVDEGPWPNTFGCVKQKFDWRLKAPGVPEEAIAPVTAEPDPEGFRGDTDPARLWLHCTECDLPVLRAAVRAFTAPPLRSIDMLVQTLEHGATPVAAAEYRDGLRENYRLLTMRGGPSGTSEAAFIETYLTRHEAELRRRAALLLLLIRTPEEQSRAADRAIMKVEREGTDAARKAIKAARASPLIVQLQ